MIELGSLRVLGNQIDCTITDTLLKYFLNTSSEGNTITQAILKSLAMI